MLSLSKWANQDESHSSGRELLPDDDYAALVFEGYVAIPETGVWTLLIGSDDGSRLYLHGDLLVDNDGPHPMQWSSGRLRLGKGLHAIRIEFFESHRRRRPPGDPGSGRRGRHSGAGVLFRQGEVKWKDERSTFHQRRRIVVRGPKLATLDPSPDRE